MSEEDLANFARRLEAVRVAFGIVTGNRNLSRAQFATLLGLGAEAYRRYERAEIEPGMAVLRVIRQVTGISLDYLVADEDWGIPNAAELGAECTATFVERLQWVRELFENDLNKVAKAMGVRPETYRRWESGREPMPEAKQQEFADRFNVSLRFLQQGLPVGIPLDVLAQLRKAHPDLWKIPDTDRESDGSTNGPPAEGDGESKTVSLDC